MDKKDITLGVIGGSGIYDLEGFQHLGDVKIDTPFGDPSDPISVFQSGGKKVAFLARHGKGHRYLPTEVPVHANVWALKSLGVKNILSISAVGSLCEEYAPKTFVIPDQILDRTKLRKQTFFGDGLVGHVSFSEPFCSRFSGIVENALKESNLSYHVGGAYLSMEGPAFSTVVESKKYQKDGAKIIGMTAIPEAKLAREAEMAYSMIAMVTDYDCWREGHDAVSVQEVMDAMKTNTQNIKKFLPLFLKHYSENFSSPFHDAAKFALMTDPKIIPEATKKKLALFYKRYWG